MRSPWTAGERDSPRGLPLRAWEVRERRGSLGPMEPSLESDAEDLGPPDLELGPLRVWIYDYAYPSYESADDANWLRATIIMHLPGKAWVRADGPFLRANDIADLIEQCAHMHRRLEGSAYLGSPAEALRVSMKMVDKLGHFRTEVEVEVHRQPNQHNHHFWLDDLDQTYLGLLVEQGRLLLRRFPVRGESLI